MPTVYLAPGDYKQAQVDLWQQAALKRINDTYAPPPAQPAAPAQPAPEATAGPGQPAAPPAAAAVSSTPPAASPPSTQTAPAAAVSPPTSAPANPSSVDDWVRNKTVDLWQQGVNSQLANGVGPVVDAINQTLSGVPQQAQNWARGVVGLPQTTSGSTTPAASPGAISGASSAPTTPTPVASGGTDYESQARAAAQKYNIDPDIFVRQLNQESGLQPFNPDGSVKTSPAGARGIAQFMPATAQGMGINPDDPGQAIDAAARMDAQNLQKYGGDWSKTLAAYNAGPGNVDKYGGIPPFEETQRYVSNILGGTTPTAGTGNAAGGSSGAANGGSGAPVAVDRTSQFQLGLSSADAMAACGPAAAIAFARLYGRNPTAQEAMQLAAQSGWTQAGGMNGVVNEKKLLDALQVPNKLETGAVDWAKVTSEVNNGNPVIVSTPGHYFTVDQAKPAQGGDQMLYHVGTSGTDLRQGAEWMTQTQIEHLEGQANGVLYADNPQAQGPSITEQVSQTASNVSSAVQSRANDILGFVQNLSNGAPQAVQNAGDFLANYGPPGLQNKALSAIGQGVTNVAQDIASQPQQNPIAQTLGAIGQAAPNPVDKAVFGAVANSPLVNQPSVLDNMQTMQELTQKYPSANGGLFPDVNAMTPEDRQAYSHAMLAVGGLLGGEGMPAESTAGSAGGADALAAARQAVQDMANRFPQMSPGSLAASGAGKQLAALETDAALHPENYVDLAQPETTRLEPEIQGALDAAKPPPQPASDVVTGLQNMVNQRNGAPNTVTPEAPTAPQPPVDVATLTQKLQALRQKIPATVDPADNGLPPPVGEPTTPISTSPEDFDGNVQTALTNVTKPKQPAPPTTPASTASPPQAPTQATAPTTNPVQPPQTTATGAATTPTTTPPVKPPTAAGGAPPPGAGVTPPTAAAGTPATPPPATSAQPGNFWQVLNAYHSGNVVMGPFTLAKVAANTVFAPVWNFGTQSARDLLTLNLARVGGRTVGMQQSLVSIGSDFMDGFTGAMGGRTTSSIPIVDHFLQVQHAVGGALHAGLQNVSAEAVRRMELGAEAGDFIAKQGSAGVTGLGNVASLIQNPAGLPAAAVARAQDMGARAGLRAPAGATQQTVQKMLNAAAGTPGGAITNFLLPVFRIGAQAASRGIEASPIGLAGTGIDVARGAAGFGPYANGFSQYGEAVTPLADRLTNNLVGTGITAWLASKALDGTITGNGPDDPKARAMLEAQGWRPQSVLVPGTGYVSYNRLPEQLKTPLMLAGAYGDAVAQGNGDPMQTASALFKNVGQALMGDLPGLQTLGDVGGILKGDPYAVGYLVGGGATGYIPGSALLGNIAQATDQFARKVPTNQGFGAAIGANIQQNLPVLREQMQPQTDVLGQPKPNTAAGLSGLLPWRTSPETQPNPIFNALAVAGINVPTAPATIAYAGRAFPLSPDEQVQRQQFLSQQLTKVITPLTNSPGFQRLPPQQQYRVLEPIVRAASTYADQRTIASIPPADRQARVQAAGSAYGRGGLTRQYGAGLLTTGGGPSLAMQQAQAAEQQTQQRHALLQQQLASR